MRRYFVLAIEKGCRLIGVNLDKWWTRNPATCPTIMRDVGALFVPFSPPIIAEALEADFDHTSDDWYYKKETYEQLGYQLIGNIAVLPAKPNPFAKRTTILGSAW